MKFGLICLFIVIIVLFWSVIVEPNILTVTHLKIKDNRLKNLRIVFASDFHIKPYEAMRLSRIVKLINKQNPDIVLLGGDYVNGHKKGSSFPIEKIAKSFSNINSKLGTFAVIGNHDGWQGKEEIIFALKSNGINVLFNSNKCFENFCIAGVDDLQTGNPNIQKAIEGIDKPTILLTHTPDILPNVPEEIVLTLAGHLHGGQVRLHKALIVPSVYGEKFANGFFNDKGKKIFTSKGLGTSILPIRFNCFPEIVVIDFE